MKQRTFVLLLAMTATLAAARNAALALSGYWTPLFNGCDFEGLDRIGYPNRRVQDDTHVADRGNCSW
jgi:hypothetical protein